MYLCRAFARNFSKDLNYSKSVNHPGLCATTYKSITLNTHDLWVQTSQTSQDKMFMAEKNEPSRAHVSAHRIPLTNQLKESSPSLVCSFSLLKRRLSLML